LHCVPEHVGTVSPGSAHEVFVLNRLVGGGLKLQFFSHLEPREST